MRTARLPTLRVVVATLGVSTRGGISGPMSGGVGGNTYPHLLLYLPTPLAYPPTMVYLPPGYTPPPVGPGSLGPNIPIPPRRDLGPGITPPPQKTE